MPSFKSLMHLNMLRGAKKRGETKSAPYGMHWGDPKEKAFLGFIRDRWCSNFVGANDVCLEIGPGGGRWTRYLLGSDHVYAVDFHQELLDELKKNYPVPHLETLKNNGSDLPGVPDESVDFLFSFGVFVHLEIETIKAYMPEINRVLKTGGTAVIQYSDKSKRQAARNDGFSQNTPSLMRKIVMDAGFIILAENLTIMPHAGIIQFTKEADGVLAKFQTYSQA